MIDSVTVESRTASVPMTTAIATTTRIRQPNAPSRRNQPGTSVPPASSNAVPMGDGSGACESTATASPPVPPIIEARRLARKAGGHPFVPGARWRGWALSRRE